VLRRLKAHGKHLPRYKSQQKDLDIFEVFNKSKEFKALIREPFCKED
jgi:hypothetical protein